MKLYIFLASSIVRVGGAQLYTARKSHYLIENGWAVIVYHHITGEIMINFNNKIKSELIEELQFSPNLFRTKRVNKVISRMIEQINKLGNINKVVIESHTINLALWGEVLASKIGGQHLIYLLGEKLPKVYGITLDFFKFKYANNSLYGITPVSLKQLFTDEQGDLAFLRAIGCSNNNIDDVPNYLMDNYKKSDWNILSIGRLDKDYIIPTFKSLANYARTHKDKSITLIILGGSYGRHNHKKAISIFKECDNVSIIDVGYVWPIPVSCFYNSDLTIASAGSAVVAESVGSPVIVIDGGDFMPIGIYKKNTNSTIFRTPEEPPINLSTLLDDILIYKKYVKDIRFSGNKSIDFSSHMSVIENIQSYYYPMNKQLQLGKFSIRRIIMSIVGTKRYTWASNIQHIIKDSIRNILCK